MPATPTNSVKPALDIEARAQHNSTRTCRQKNLVQLERPQRQQQRQPAGEDGDENALDEQLANDPPTAGANGHANRDLAPAYRGRANCSARCWSSSRTAKYHDARQRNQLANPFGNDAGMPTEPPRTT
jgi:hypothetical protein